MSSFPPWDPASSSSGITDTRTGPLSREDQSLGLSVPGRLPFATLGWVSRRRGGVWNVSGFQSVGDERRVLGP